MTKKQTLRLVGVCYGALAVCWLLLCLFNFAADSVLFASGKLQTAEYTLSQLELVNMELKGENEAVSTTDDAQIIIPVNGRVTQVRLQYDMSAQPGEVNLYYTRGDEPFTDTQKIWGKRAADGSYTFALPRGYIRQIRIDPTNRKRVKMQCRSLVVNGKRSFGAYFALSGEQVFRFLVLPALVSSALAWLYTAFPAAGQKLLGLPRRLVRRKDKKEGKNNG